MEIVLSKNCNKKLSKKEEKRMMAIMGKAAFASKEPKIHIDAISAKELIDVKK